MAPRYARGATIVMTENAPDLDHLIADAESDLAALDAKRAEIIKRIESLRQESARACGTDAPAAQQTDLAAVTMLSRPEEKIALFRSLFRGRQDVYPRRFESAKTKRSGYQPDCRNEWRRPICRKPRVKCVDCESREFIPVSDEVIASHLKGVDANSPRKDFTIGVYPMLLDETCHFLAADFDKSAWQKDAAAFRDTCRAFGVPVVLERSRSGNGGHVWFFFKEPVSAATARRMGAFLLTETMERRPEVGLDSYDRFFPNQDTMPRGGFGNLIALPLQKRPRESGNSVFVDDAFEPFEDQWAFLASVKTITVDRVEAIVEEAQRRGRVVGVRMALDEEDDPEPWTALPSRKRKRPTIEGPLPEKLTMVLGNQVYVPKEDLSPALKNSLIRIAAFQNPEFYKAQAMRFPTFDKPRVIGCCEDFPAHLGLPRGCLDEALELCESLGIEVELLDERYSGKPIDIVFQGNLRSEQQTAAEAMLAYDTGVLSASTAFGKTVVACHLIAARKTNTLVVVHRKQLLDQWIARLGSFLDLDPKEIGQLGGGRRKPSGVIDVAIIQSLSRKGEVDDIVGEYGHLIVDECHHVSARSFEIVARQCKAKYVTGLSATVTRKDGHHPIIFMQCGPIRYKVDDRKQAEQRPFHHRVVARYTDVKLPDLENGKPSAAIHEVYAALVNDEERNRMIVNDVIAAVRAGRSPIVLTERRDHLAVLRERLSASIENVFELRGGMGQKQRKRLAAELEELPEDKERIIVATGRYIGEGFDDARLDTLFLALPVSWRGTLAQYAGRLHRLHDMKREVIVYDYADRNVPMLANMFKRRRRGYKAIGYEISEGNNAALNGLLEVGENAVTTPRNMLTGEGQSSNE